MKLTGETEVLGDTTVLVPLCPPQIPTGMVWNRTRASAGTGRRLTLFIVKRRVYKQVEGVRKGYAHGTFSVASGCMSDFTLTTVPSYSQKYFGVVTRLRAGRPRVRITAG